jgi:hypothetical protein
VNFKEKISYIKNNKKLDISKFDKVSEITNAIDFINNARDKELHDNVDNEVHEISKFLANIMFRKSFHIKNK